MQHRVFQYNDVCVLFEYNDVCVLCVTEYMCHMMSWCKNKGMLACMSYLYTCIMKWEMRNHY